MSFKNIGSPFKQELCNSNNCMHTINQTNNKLNTIAESCESNTCLAKEAYFHWRQPNKSNKLAALD